MDIDLSKLSESAYGVIHDSYNNVQTSATNSMENVDKILSIKANRGRTSNNRIDTLHHDAKSSHSTFMNATSTLINDLASTVTVRDQENSNLKEEILKLKHEKNLRTRRELRRHHSADANLIETGTVDGQESKSSVFVLLAFNE